MCTVGHIKRHTYLAANHDEQVINIGDKLHMQHISRKASSSRTVALLAIVLLVLSSVVGPWAGVAAGQGKDQVPPAAPTNVSAVAGNKQTQINWNANTETDIAGYNVYRAKSRRVNVGVAPVNGRRLVTTTSYIDKGLANDVAYFYIVQAVDTSGNKSQPVKSGSGQAIDSSGYIQSDLTATPQAAADVIDLKVNFQTATSVVPAGYLSDFGEPYGARTGADQGVGQSYGWVTPGSTNSISLVGNGRERNIHADQRLDTLMHMQYTGGSGVKATGAWEVSVPNDAYTVTVGVGDAGAFYDSVHQISIEGQVAISGFVPTSANRFAMATRTAVSYTHLTLPTICSV